MRVSTHGQARNGNSLQDQQQKLMDAGVAEQDIVIDVYTGTKMDRPGFDTLMTRLCAGDELVVCKLDRFARTATDGSALVRDLVERGVRVNILNMGVADNTPMGKLMVTVLLAFSEYERDCIVERTQAGKDIARQRPDYREGRPRKAYNKQLFETISNRVYRHELTQQDAATELGMSRPTFGRLFAKWRETQQKA